MSEESMPVALAKESLRYYMEHEKIMPIQKKSIHSCLLQPAGVFVSLKKNGQLRGCIGTILPTQESAAQEIVRNAVSAAVEDPRFPRVTASELAELDVSVDILGAPERIESIAQLDPKKYGVIVQLGRRSGVLLPDLEGVESAMHQVEIACSKAGINPAEKFTLYRFQVTRHK